MHVLRLLVAAFSHPFVPSFAHQYSKQFTGPTPDVLASEPIRIGRMTGRGDVVFSVPNRSANATFELGLALSTSSPTLDPSSSPPVFLIVTARILATPRPDSSITLATHLNALGGLGNRSFNNIVCVSPKTAGQKRIEIWPRGWPQYKWDPDDLRDGWDFVTVPANGKLEVRHPVDGTKIAEARLKAGERYQASLTDECLGTRWWAFGSLEELEGVRFRQWREGEVEKRADDEGADEGVRYLRGEFPDNLALVIEKETAEFEIGETVE